MYKILVLIDLTSISEIALNQAIQLAKQKKANLTICHITDSIKNSEMLNNELVGVRSFMEKSDIEYDLFIGHGEFKREVTDYINLNRPNLVVVVTHGKIGLKQTLFGSNIYALVKTLPCTVLVLNNNSMFNENGFKKVLLPIAPHSDFMNEVRQAVDVLSNQGEIILFNIVKPGVNLDTPFINNIESTKAFLEASGVKYKYQLLESTKFSIGYSKETIEFAKGAGVDLISIMTKSSGNPNVVSTDIDKENLLLNEEGIAILCTNS